MTVFGTILSVARGEIGYHEGKSNGHWNNHQRYSAQVPGLEWSDYQPWCATYVSWLALKAGAASLFPRTAACTTGVAWFKARGRWSEYPAVGAQVFYGPGGGTHTGIVESFDADTITTIEGNTNTNGSAEGDGVYRRKRQRRDTYVYGYGVPAYDGLISADPRWGGKKSGSATPAHVPVKVDLSNLIRALKDYPKHPATGSVKEVQRALHAEGLYSGDLDGIAGPKTKAAYKAYQHRLGYSGKDADGIPGKTSATKLAKKRGFTLVA
ncbi:CHAP domain-containing protein [Actinacidiphila glaucinigra]|uniref:CHAP domain-containing protein n=1 Tax=Actinacidiphila glaucinigra TaxID=235986 RepID=UPI003D912D8A